MKINLIFYLMCECLLFGEFFFFVFNFNMILFFGLSGEVYYDGLVEKKFML